MRTGGTFREARVAHIWNVGLFRLLSLIIVVFITAFPHRSRGVAGMSSPESTLLASPPLLLFQSLLILSLALFQFMDLDPG